MKFKRTIVLLAAAAASSAMLAIPATAEASTVPPCDTGFGGAWCIWEGINATGNSLVSTGSISNLASVGYRNEDESIVNNAWLNDDYYLRLYYSTNYGGSWVCINPVAYIPNASKYSFNNGPSLAGYGQSIWKNVASASWTTTPCGNPIA